MKKIIMLALFAAALAGCPNEPSHKYDVPVIVDIMGNVMQPDVTADIHTALEQALACPADQLVWSIQEGVGPLAGGLITQGGVYTSPSCGSPYIGATVHVVATGCGRTGIAPISITQETLNSIALDRAFAWEGTADVCVPPKAALGTACPGDVNLCPSVDGCWCLVMGQQVTFHARLDFTCTSAYTLPLPSPVPTNACGNCGKATCP